MRIKKVFYRKIKVAGKEEVVPRKKVVLEKVEDDAYLCREYSWDKLNKEWIPICGGAFFDGVKVQDTGLVKTRTNNDVDRYFELLVTYEKFSHMLLSEVNDSSEKELEYINKINKEKDIKRNGDVKADE